MKKRGGRTPLLRCTFPKQFNHYSGLSESPVLFRILVTSGRPLDPPHPTHPMKDKKWISKPSLSRDLKVVNKTTVHIYNRKTQRRTPVRKVPLTTFNKSPYHQQKLQLLKYGFRSTCLESERTMSKTLLHNEFEIHCNCGIHTIPFSTLFPYLYETRRCHQTCKNGQTEINGSVYLTPLTGSLEFEIINPNVSFLCCPFRLTFRLCT